MDTRGRLRSSSDGSQRKRPATTAASLAMMPGLRTRLVIDHEDLGQPTVGISTDRRAIPQAAGLDIERLSLTLFGSLSRVATRMGPSPTKQMASPTYAGKKPIGRGAQKNDDRSALGKLRSLAPVTTATVSVDESEIASCALAEDGTFCDEFFEEAKTWGGGSRNTTQWERGARSHTLGGRVESVTLLLSCWAKIGCAQAEAYRDGSVRARSYASWPRGQSGYPGTDARPAGSDHTVFSLKVGNGVAALIDLRRWQ